MLVSGELPAAPIEMRPLVEIAAIAAALVPPFAILDRVLAVRARRSQTRGTVSVQSGERAR